MAPPLLFQAALTRFVLTKWPPQCKRCVGHGHATFVANGQGRARESIGGAMGPVSCQNGEMLLTPSLTGQHASALGHLLHKHSDRVQTFDLPVGAATVFYPESSPVQTTAALMLEVDPIGMVLRRLRSREGLSPTDYFTDRPYAASSLLAVALGRIFNTAMNGRCDSFRVSLDLSSGGLESLCQVLFRPRGRRQSATADPRVDQARLDSEESAGNHRLAQAATDRSGLGYK
jgi:hypothetical protein